ncbi:DNA-binding transcriptional regulator, FadR family [Parafrankia irregularis]|uniref:DNA-binding transcriptional regulator, FadR family n=1 Tax=Parafrankia irregularis TaxID=795642 RepID=A0A0S4QUH7_9ACTN|nr:MULTISPECIES: FCD domain-containing protein [Parafrankia]MBE3199985.1 FadR family transcriptional regulator [Parafrankia sp. CH37]CUU59269.1 DNA-binding transcriptional regulator, FadR family [Parafrankia irregularis]
MAQDGGGSPAVVRTGVSPAREKPQLIADELRLLIVGGQVADGDLLGRERDLVERFGVSRPSLREALRILEAQGLVSVRRGVLGGIFAQKPDERVTARTAALLLLARNVLLADVYTARSHLEPIAARQVAESPRRDAAADELGALIADQEEVIASPKTFFRANSEFHQRLMALAGNQTMAVVAETLREVMANAVAVGGEAGGSTPAIRRQALRSQRRLVELVRAGDGAGAEDFWRSRMLAASKLMLGDQADRVVDVINCY